MNIKKTIENIRKTSDKYIDHDLMAFIIDDNNLMGTNNIFEIDEYEITNDDSYENRLLKIHKNENIFLAMGMMTFMPFVNECELFSEEDYLLKLNDNEFQKYADEKEKLFGILLKKGSDEYKIGKTDPCSCSVDASFEEIEKTDTEFYKTIENIIHKKIIN